jgi:hypothetical protein
MRDSGFEFTYDGGLYRANKGILEKIEKVCRKINTSLPESTNEDLGTYNGVKYSRLQDNDCDWYWIPNEKVREFCSDKSELEGKEYMDCPNDFDEFQRKYELFATGGDPDLTPHYYNNLKQ